MLNVFPVYLLPMEKELSVVLHNDNNQYLFLLFADEQGRAENYFGKVEGKYSLI